VRIAIAQVEADCRGLAHRLRAVDQRRDLTERVQRSVSAVAARLGADVDEFVGGAHLFEDGFRRGAAKAWCSIQLIHDVSSRVGCSGLIPIAGDRRA